MNGAGPARSRLGRHAGTLCGAALFVLIAVVLIEILYRAQLGDLVAAEVERATPGASADFAAFGVAPWRFDREIGFSFFAQPWRMLKVKGGAVESCETDSRGDRLGNYVVSHTYDPDDYVRADLRLLIAGSSYSLMEDERRRLVNEVLQDRLSARLGRRVHALNFSRDSTGVLSYFDVLAHELPRRRPHAAIVLVNRPGLMYPRHWRSVTDGEGGFRRMTMSLDPVERPADPDRSVRTAQVITERITPEWCREMQRRVLAQGGDGTRDDPLLQALIAQYMRLHREVARPRVALDLWRTGTSFAWRRLRWGDPFHGLALFGAGRFHQPLALARYRDDAGFRAALAAVEAAGTPVIVVQIPTYADLRAGGLWHDLSAQERGLVADLEQAAGPLVPLFPHYPPDMRDPRALVRSEQDSHPSALGVAAMAAALERLLLADPRTAALVQR
jgi:hypothetical protein